MVVLVVALALARVDHYCLLFVSAELQGRKKARKTVQRRSCMSITGMYRLGFKKSLCYGSAASVAGLLDVPVHHLTVIKCEHLCRAAIWLQGKRWFREMHEAVSTHAALLKRVKDPSE